MDCQKNPKYMINDCTNIYEIISIGLLISIYVVISFILLKVLIKVRAWTNEHRLKT
jgi:hypothetical protein